MPPDGWIALVSPPPAERVYDGPPDMRLRGAVQPFLSRGYVAGSRWRAALAYLSPAGAHPVPEVGEE